MSHEAPRSVSILDLKAQFRTIQDDVRAAIERVITSQHFILGPEVETFEKEVAVYLGAAHAIGCANGTDALVLALLALDIGPGDGVLTTPWTYIATAEAIARVGARPVFVDVKDDDLNICPDALERAIASPPAGVRLRAILPVHIFGRACEIERIMKLAEKHDLFVIEDTAQALGANKSGKKLGTFADIGTYSFFPSKNLGAFGDGGLLTTDDEKLATRLKQLRVHGQKARYIHDELGLNSRLDALQAAILRVKLPHLDSWNDGRRSQMSKYRKELLGTPVTTLAHDGDGRHDIFHLCVVRAPRRDELVKHLQQKGIQCVVHYPKPLHVQPCFAPLGYKEGDFPSAEKASREVVSLPLYPELSDADRGYVVSEIRNFFGA